MFVCEFFQFLRLASFTEHIQTTDTENWVIECEFIVKNTRYSTAASQWGKWAAQRPYSQKQPFRSVLKKRCSENMQQIYRKVLMPKCDFKIALWHGFSPVICCIFSEHLFLRTPLASCFCVSYKSNHMQVFCKKMLLKISLNLNENS